MEHSLIVSDASPLIALSQIDGLDLLRQLFTAVVIPPAVRREIAPSVVLPPWIEERRLSEPLDASVGAMLGAGEREAISLAIEIGASRIILDDLRARRRAESLGLNVVGTLGLLVLVKQHGLIPAVRPFADKLLAVGFFVSRRVIDDALATAGEA